MNANTTRVNRKVERHAGKHFLGERSAADERATLLTGKQREECRGRDQAEERTCQRSDEAVVLLVLAGRIARSAPPMLAIDNKHDGEKPDPGQHTGELRVVSSSLREVELQPQLAGRSLGPHGLET
jgi:hypothetical protein